MPYNECLCLRGRGPAGTCGYRIWGKIGTQGWGKNSKPAVVAVKRDKECVCVCGVQLEMGRGEWGKRLSLGIFEHLGNVSEI